MNIDQKPSHELYYVRIVQAARGGYALLSTIPLGSQGWIWTNAMGDRQQGMVMGYVVSCPFIQSGFDIHGPKFQPWTGSSGWIWPILSGIPRHMMLTFDGTPLPAVGKEDRDE